jgi:hypothetical protein
VKLYTAPKCAKWGLLRWLYDGGFNPLIDIFTHTSADMVDIHAEVLLEILGCDNDYLRIQVTLFIKELIVSLHPDWPGRVQEQSLNIVLSQ